MPLQSGGPLEVLAQTGGFGTDWRFRYRLEVSVQTGGFGTDWKSGYRPEMRNGQ
jgi:hypothetical protein